MRITFVGLSITSSWGNGHATNFRGLVAALDKRGHDVVFLERDVPWYEAHRDLPHPPYGRTELYSSTAELKERYAHDVRDAEAVVVGSYVYEGVPTIEWVIREARGLKVFYDIDTPITVAKLEADDREYLAREQVPQFDLYLSFTGGPLLDRLERVFGAREARAFYCIADPDEYHPEHRTIRWDLGYLGTYSDDRQVPLERLMLDAARQRPDLRFVVAGPNYPVDIEWPANVERIDHLPPSEHRGFYNSQRFTLNVTRAQMIKAGYSPSVRLFEAAACGVPVISDRWKGLDTVFDIGEEILIANDASDTVSFLIDLDEERRKAIGARARRKVLEHHTAARRAEELEGYIHELMGAERAD